MARIHTLIDNIMLQMTFKTMDPASLSRDCATMVADRVKVGMLQACKISESWRPERRPRNWTVCSDLAADIPSRVSIALRSL